MAVIHTSRTASLDEIVQEMDRRGTVIEALEAEIAALRARAEKAEAEVARLGRSVVEYFEAYDAITTAERRGRDLGADAYDHLGTLAAALQNASRPDPAQPGQSSAQPAAERNICKICDGTSFVHGVDGLTVCPFCVGATPPAAGSAAGMGE